MEGYRTEDKQEKTIPEYFRWFPESRFGMFLHWGPYAMYGRGEQVLLREHMDQRAYEKAACEWNPKHYDPGVWASVARKAGMKYACLTARHHDGYCLWDTSRTNYSSAKQAPGRDFVREYVDAFRAEGLKTGLYYSCLDWRIPAYFDGPKKDPRGWEIIKRYIYDQVEELLTNYGQIDYFFFDGIWPRNAEELGSRDLMKRMRRLQPHILINNRLDCSDPADSNPADGGAGAGGSADLGDFGTPEHRIAPEANRMWESCQVATWRLWGYGKGERWRPADLLLDMLCECAEKGGNLILNVGPDEDGQLPPEFTERMADIGRWLEVHGEAVYGTEGGDITEFLTYGRQTVKGNNLYLIFRFWDGNPEIRLADLTTKVKSAELLTTGQKLEFEQKGEEIFIRGLPKERPTALFPVIKLVCDGKPAANQWGIERNWNGDPGRIAKWARTRGESVYTG